MKHLWLIATMLLLNSYQSPVWAFDTKDDADIEAEETAADAAGSELNAGYLDAKKEQQKLDTRLDSSRAEKAVKESKIQEAYSEVMIDKAQEEIDKLKKEQSWAIYRRHKAEAAKKAAIEKLAKTLKELKAYRAQVKREKALAMHEEQKVSLVNSRTAKIQGMLPGH